VGDQLHTVLKRVKQAAKLWPVALFALGILVSMGLSSSTASAATGTGGWVLSWQGSSIKLQRLADPSAKTAVSSAVNLKTNQASAGITFNTAGGGTCGARASILVDTGGHSAHTLSFLPQSSIGGAGGNVTACTEAQMGGSSFSDIAISGTPPKGLATITDVPVNANGDLKITVGVGASGGQNASIHVNPTALTVTAPGGKVTKLTAQSACDYGPSGTSSDARDETCVQSVTLANQVPGTYKICATAVNVCKSFNETASNFTSGVTLNLPNTGASRNALYTSTDPDTSGHDPNATCETGGFGLNWIICPVFNATADFCDWIFQNIVQPFLITSPISTDPTNADGTKNTSFAIWSQFRVYGNVLLVIGLLVLVFGQSIGGGLIDAYTVKKAMPRILIAAILINLSIYIVAGLVDITNVVGGTLGNVMTAPLANAGAFNFSPSTVEAGSIIGSTGIVAALGVTGGIAAGLASVAVGQFILLFLIMPVVLGLLSAFVTLLLRKAAILALILVSPVAFALYCLPNTEKYFKKWWDFLVQTLLVYPIVIIIFAVADILSVTVYNANKDQPGAVNAGSPTIALIIAFLLQFLPLLMIPYAFKLAGGAVGLVHETLTNYHKRGQEAVKGNVNDPLSLRNRTRNAALENIGRSRAATIRAGHGPDASRYQRLRSRVAFGLPGGRNYVYGESRRNAAAQKLAEEMSATGDDSQRYAAAGFRHNRGDRAQSVLTMRDGTKIPIGAPVPTSSWFDGKGRQVSDLEHRQAVSTFGRGPSAAAQNLEYLLRKKQTDDDVGNFRHAFAAQAIGQNWTTGESVGNWAAATYGHKSTIGSEWFSKPTVYDSNGVKQGDTGYNGTAARVDWKDVSADAGAYNGLVKDMHKSRGPGFKLSDVNDMDWRAMGKHQEDVERTIETGGTLLLSPQTLENYVLTSEVLETASHAQGVQFDEDGKNVQVGGTNAASKGVIEAVLNNRRYGVQQTPQVDATGKATGQESQNERSIYEFAPVQTVKAAKGDVLQAVADHTVAKAYATGDPTRPNVPRSVTPS
jgi:hypothetical protein